MCSQISLSHALFSRESVAFLNVSRVAHSRLPGGVRCTAPCSLFGLPLLPQHAWKLPPGWAERQSMGRTTPLCHPDQPVAALLCRSWPVCRLVSGSVHQKGPFTLARGPFTVPLVSFISLEPKFVGEPVWASFSIPVSFRPGWLSEPLFLLTVHTTSVAEGLLART